MKRLQLGCLEDLRWSEIKEINRLGFDFATALEVLENDAWRVESEEESFELHFAKV